MLTYVYACPHCDHEWDECHRIGFAPREMACPKCGKAARLQVTGGSGFVLRGPDWAGKEIHK